VASFVDWYNHRHRHSGIKFVTPYQRHNGDAVEICRNRAVVYEQARQGHPRRWKRTRRYWRQPEVVSINPPTPESEHQPTTFAMASRTAAGASSLLAVTGAERPWPSHDSSKLQIHFNYCILGKLAGVFGESKG
jgi:hypothetical protein